MPSGPSFQAVTRQLLRVSVRGERFTFRRAFSTTMRRDETYGFIGLGAMGYPMATNLRAKLPAGDTLLVHDLNKAATEKFVQEVGIAAAGIEGEGKSTPVEAVRDAREVAERSDVIITVLPEPQHVESLFYSMLTSHLPGHSSNSTRLFIDCSTIDPLTSRNVASSVSSSSAGIFVDAPMSGGVVGARAGSLTFMLGAPNSIVPRTTSILEKMGRRVFHLGEQGAGLAGKLANNYLLAISNIATAEAMNLGLKLGLEAESLGELINSSSGRCWASAVNNPVLGVCKGAPVERDYEGGFGVGLMRKDLRLAIAAAKDAGARLELGQEGKRIYDEVFEADGLSRKDFGVVFKWLGGDEAKSGKTWQEPTRAKGR